MPAFPSPKDAFLAAFVLALCSTASASAPEAAEPTQTVRHSFFSDYYFRVLDGKEAWPYFGGHDDAFGDLADWKFSTPGSPDQMDLAELAAGLEKAVHQSLNWRRDGLDLWFKQRLFVELAGVLSQVGAYPVHVSPHTCEERGLVTEEGFLGSSWVPPATGDELLSPERTDDLAGLARILCREIQQDFDNGFRESNRGLLQRYVELDEQTRFLDGQAAVLLDGVSLEELPALAVELPALPPGETVLGWMEEFDTLMGLWLVRMNLRPDWAPLGAAFELEAMMPAAEEGSHLVDCRRWVPFSRVKFEEDRFLDSFVRIDEGYLWFQDDHAFAFEPPPGNDPPEQVAAKIGLALLGLAHSSAEHDGVALMRQDTAERRHYRYMKIPHRPATSPEYWLTMARGRYPHWVGNPLALATTLKRRVDRDVLVGEFGTSFGNALADYRDTLRKRVLTFGSGKVPVEKFLYASARLGLNRSLTVQSSPLMVKRIYPWLTPEIYAALFQAWPSVAQSWATEPLYALLREGLDAFRTMRDLPDAESGIFKIRALEDLITCTAPLLKPEQLAAVENKMLHARQNFLDSLHADLKARIEAHCSRPDAGPPDVLQRRVRSLADRLLPGGHESSLDRLVDAFSLTDPCNADRDAVLLRFGAVYDLMTAVFALENYAAGGSIDSSFDRSLALATVEENFSALQAQRAADRARQEKGLMRHLDEDPLDPVPELVFAPEILFVPVTVSEDLHALLQDGDKRLETRLSGRAYPDDLLLTGWRPLDDYIEEEDRHRRIDVLLQRGVDPRTRGFELRVVFSHRLRYANLLGPDGEPAPLAEWITWRRVQGPAGEKDSYLIEYSSAEDSPSRFVVPVPVHHRIAGPRTLAAARSFAEIYLRAGP